ncbi:MAG: hypothetical protein ACOCTP_02795, partial [Roseicyclus sp.]
MTQDGDGVLSAAEPPGGAGARAQDGAGHPDAWAGARRLIDGWKGGINIAHEALDRHVATGHGEALAIRWLGKSGARRDLSYADLTA